jgi:AmmeMemoRadiSam system protein A
VEQGLTLSPSSRRKIMFDTSKEQTLLHLARAAIAKELGFVSHDLPRPAWLEEPGAAFVTLTLHGQLRGCIGSLEANRPLIDDVRHNAVAAAFQDPRFAPLTKEEFADVIIDVALLSTPEPIRFSSEQDALAQLNPGLDGVTLEYGSHRATHLPHAWENLPDPRVFLTHLKNQARLPEDFWSDDIKLSRFTIRKWREGGQREGDKHG